MIFLPAIDLKGGLCVRLVRGEMETAVVFNDDPADQARVFEDAGCRWLHVVDLDGAFAGRPMNIAAVEAILAATKMRVELGGGIRDMETAGRWLDQGVDRVVLGSAAVNDPAFAREACRAWPRRVAIGIDARDGMVAVHGWASATKVKAADLARSFEADGPAAIIYTDIARDGTMEGPNIAATTALAEAVTTPVILSGGISSMDDLATVRTAGHGSVAGVICGRAIYEGRVDPGAAVALLSGAATPEAYRRC
ncbi:MAG: 1-(5-phosphoribosyl)-5-[(5-phosphoribosylamino)methylideneamino]imidazole-4-carboxamide isomerase [Rhodospirillales bacterium]|nr:1-(5-phosphoribosyl)-5-[(5-phosphoribosylamino)methylideneamino]imidazole-4-carboxamide isomerase [Rhodospirillales bacterium]